MIIDLDCAMKNSIYLSLMVFFSLCGSALCADSMEIMQQAKFYYEQRNFDRAASLYLKAVALDNHRAMFMLGSMYERGEGVSKDIFEAVEWYKKSANLGSVSALKRLANMYYDGEGVVRDYGMAELLYRRAGDLGDSNSLFLLGQMYWLGSMGVKKSQEAVVLFKKSSAMGNPLAMNALAVAYRLGDGVQKNNSYAYAYFKLSRDFGNGLAGENFNQLLAKISASERDVGEREYSRVREEVDRYKKSLIGF